ncbi:MAG: hypothetical protein M3Y37_11830, partial [Chloroflexota bacterium]|nr:hypothetical protein [Chloroflexota bacterium]
PDFLITLTVDTGQQMLVPVDAKFSVETAKPRQVSAEMASALLDAERSPVRPLLESVSGLCDGFFLSPDFELTHQVLAGASGILRAAVNRTQVLMLTAPASVLYGAADVQSLAAELAALDRSRGEAESQLAAALYYVRCAFACAAAHRDITRPLLGDRRTEPADLDEVRQALPDRTDGNASAWTVIQEWDRDAEEVRAIRISVHQAAEVGIPNRDLRDMIERYAQSAGIEPPSVNRVRRDLALWSTDQMVETFGTINYPVEDLDRLLRRLRNRARDLQAQVPARVREIVTGSASR